MPTAIEFNNIGKQYRLGLVSTRTLSHDLNRWWQTAVLHKEDPYLKIGAVNDRSTVADSEYVWALKDINFKVEQGDVVGIIGKNGAGKSTLLKLLSRVTGPTTGTIKARGRIGSLLEVGTGFHPEMTGRENIFMNGAILGMTKAEISRKLDEIVDFSGCERYIDTPVKRYSSGMMVRLGFAVAAHLDPEILVVDEVLAVGDAEFQKKAIGKMKDVSQGQGRTVLFVSHNMGSVRSLCTKGVLLEKGQVKFMGGIIETIDEYLVADTLSGEKIVDLISNCKEGVAIKKIFVNGSQSTRLTLTSDGLDMHIKILGVLQNAQKLSLEMQVSDAAGVPVMLYSKNYGDSPIFPAGEFDIDEIVRLPKGMMAGPYCVDIYLTNSTVEGIVDIPRAFILEIADCVSPSGYSLSYKNNQGYMYLS